MQKIFTLLVITVICQAVLGSSSVDTINGCNAGFTYSIKDSLLYGPAGHGLQLISEFQDPAVYHKWNLSNGLESDEPNPFFIIAPADSVLEVCHKVVDYTGILCEHCEEVYIPPAGQPDCYVDFSFYKDSTINCNCLEAYRFFDQSSDAVSWKWWFGDGETSDQQNPVHYYNEPGFYYIVLQVTTSSGCNLSASQHILIRSADECDLTIDYQVIKTYPPSYQFYSNVYDPRLPYSHIPSQNDSSWFEIIQYFWDFGDGNFSMESFPEHVFKHSGRHIVKLEITYADGFRCNAELTDYFTGLDSVAGCDYLGTFYRNYMKSGYDVIFNDNGEVYQVQQILPEIYLPDQARINFSFTESGDTVYIGKELFRSVFVPCVGLIDNLCNLNGTVKDYTGLDGCGYLIELDNGPRLEPAIVHDSIKFYDGQRVRLSYTERNDMVSICMAGVIAEITCIEEIEPDTLLPPPHPYCEQIMLNTSFAISGGACNGSASVEIITPCNAWWYYEMIKNTEYKILWSTGETTKSIYGLCPGNLYFVNVTNTVSGNTYTAAFSIFQLSNLFPSWTFTNSGNTYWFNLPVDDAYDVTWEFDDGITVIGNSASHTFSSGGSHQVELTVEDDSGNLLYSQTIQLSVPSNIVECYFDKFIVFPNPARDVINMRLKKNHPDNASISIYNYSGKLVVTKNLNSIASENTFEIDISGLNSGLYFLVVRTSTNSQSIKFEKY